MNEPLTVQEVPASYQVKLDTLRFKQGYKQTEVGVIPEDWEVQKLVNVATIATGNTPPTSVTANYGDDYFFVSPADLGEHKYILDAGKKLSKKGFAISRKFPANSILFTCIGSTIGKCGVAPIELTSNQQINAIFPDNSFSSEYLYYELSFLAPRIKALAGEQAVPLINKTQFGDSLVAVPTIPEQRAIATALSDVDALLAAQDKLIAKKRDIKQAAMQQLLTGKQRLPGFTGEWEVKRLEDVATVLKGNGLSKGKVSQSGSAKCVLYGELFTIYSRVITDVLSSTDSCEGSLSINGDVLLPGSTTTIGIDLATASALLCNDVLLGGDINIVRAKGNFYSSTFLAYLLTEEKKHKIAEMAQGITIIHLYGKSLLKLEICLPAIEEQTAIATVLSDMDADLTALEQQRDKTQALKQGMMQQLLTGKIRLI